MTQKEALEILKMGHNVYLTGSAGSGKTFLLNEYIKFLREHEIDVGITASTGIAATHLGGMTIHSWTGLGIRDQLTSHDLTEIARKPRLKKRFARTTVLVIDEVSMLHSYRLDLIDQVCKMFKGNEEPFGGIQVVLCGDFFQLPPISRGAEKAEFIHKSKVWQEMGLKVCYLNEQHRHGDEVLTKILNDIRENKTGEHTRVPLRKRYRKAVNSNFVPTKLYTHNADVDIINQRQLNAIENEEHVFEMICSGNKNIVDAMKKSCLAPEVLRLKKGALVMFVKNSQEKKYVNGTLGTIIAFGEGGLPIAKMTNGKSITVKRESWVIEEDGKIKAELKQVPLRLAWAITVHKSQGMSLDAAEIDLSKSFVPGMGYVALSRLRTIKGLRLMGLNDLALEVNRDALELDRSLRDMSEKAREYLSGFSDEEKGKAQKNFVKSVSPTQEQKEEKLDTLTRTKILVDNQIPISDIADQRGLTIGTVISHLEKLLLQDEKMDLRYLKSDLVEGRLERIKEAFVKAKTSKLSPVRRRLGDDYSFDELRLARLVLGVKS